MRANKVKIVAVGTDDADFLYLARITNNSDSVIKISSGDFQKAFLNALDIIYSRQAFDISSGTYSMLESLMRAGIWTMILSIVIVMPLIMTENLILNNPLLSVGQFSTITGGAGLAGFISGFIGQVFFDYFSSRIVQILHIANLISTFCIVFAFLFLAIIIISAFQKKNRTKKSTLFNVFCITTGIALFAVILKISIISFSIIFLLRSFLRLFSWGMWGMVLIVSCGMIIPNFKMSLACIAGAVGGVVCCTCFLMFTAYGSKPEIARIITSVLLGVIISILIYIVKRYSRKIFVEVVNMKTGIRTYINLGDDAVTFDKNSRNGVTELSLEGDSLQISSGNARKVLTIDKSMQIGDFRYNLKSCKSQRS